MIAKLKKLINTRYNFLLLIILVLIIIFCVFSSLGYENINVDQFLWYERTERFFTAIKSCRFLDTYQQYHPGVTLMYLIGLGQFSYRVFTGDTSSFSDISSNNFGTYNSHTKLYIVIFCLGVLIYSASLIYKITGKKNLSIIFLIVTFLESFYIGVLRNLHMDGVLSVLIFASVLSFYYACVTDSVKFFIISGVLTGLGYLTKSVSIFITLFCLIYFIYFFTKDRKNRKSLILKFVLWTFVSVTIYFALFPAMWVSPIKIIVTIFKEGVIDTGVDGNFSHYLNNTVTQDPGFTFYLKVLAYRVTPVLQFLLFYFLINFIICCKGKRLKDINPLLIFSLLFSLIYFTTFVFLKKKTDRYLAPLFPFLSLLGSYSMLVLGNKLFDIKTNRSVRLFLSMFLFFIISYNVWNVITIRPYFFAYYNHVLGGIDSAKKEMYINQGGIGVFEIAKYIEEIHFQNPPRISATNERELQKVSKYKVEPPYPHLKKEYDLVITPLQRDAYFEWKKKIIKVFKIQGQDYWYVFSDLEI